MCLKERPDYVKLNLDEFSTTFNKSYLEQVNGVLQPNINRLAQDGLEFAQRYDIEILAITLEEYGAVVVYRKDHGKYIVIHVPAATIDRNGTLCAGDSFIASFNLKLYRGKSVPQSAIYAVAAGSATVELPGAQVETNPAVIEAMVERMHAQWGQDIVTKITTPTLASLETLTIQLNTLKQSRVALKTDI